MQLCQFKLKGVIKNARFLQFLSKLGVLVLSIYVITAIIYATVVGFLYQKLAKQQPINKQIFITALLIGAGLHAFLLFPQIITAYGLNLHIFNTISLISLFFLVFFVLFCLYRPIMSLGILAVPTALAGLSVGFFGRAPYEPLGELTSILQAHILLSFAAYCVLLMATVQAIILKLQIRELKHQTIHRFWVSKLPSLQSMENLLFDMILAGFVILSIALGLGFVSTYDIMAQHIAHKLFFSVLSWLIFGIFIIGHYRFGWRSKRAANFTIYGFILLAVGFVGSKAVLELLI
ncbi:cytochrome c biogenesis protein CcsA [Moraxella haemolytica]|uniref:cytochrome C assembly family protein n=1 Tax=Moraxella haemolytica TaxID=2904119 RepID=UPI002543F4AA|nr:cytochrome c biogenesis protein CcsA [Moraxella sp. ZY171148]WII94489.1 cytochrome c biogenesis protein CcsA [Moraxella sp. ZY171148]